MTEEQLNKEAEEAANNDLLIDYPDEPIWIKGYKAGYRSREQWTRFEDRKPEVGQEILIAWPSAKFQPEYRIWKEENNSEDWSFMRWFPIPKHGPLESPSEGR